MCPGVSPVCLDQERGRETASPASFLGGGERGFTHPRVGASRAFGLPQAAAKRLLRAEARTHFPVGAALMGLIDNNLITVAGYTGYPRKDLVWCASQRWGHAIPDLFTEVNFMAERTRNQVVAFRVTKAERRQIDTKVRSSGLSQQAYLLRAALGEPICVVGELKPILAELRGWGRNLNQLTVLAHSGRVQTVYLKCSPKVGQKLCGKAILNSVLDRT